MAEDLSVNRVNPSEASKANQAARQIAQRTAINQVASEESFTDWANDAIFSPTLMTRNFQPLELRTRKTQKDEEAEKTEKKDQVRQIEKLQEVSDQYSRKNPELQTKSLLLLRSRINANDTKEEILRKVLESYPDFSLADEALEFLLETSDGKLSSEVRQAREDLNLRFGREVRAGRNIGAKAREFSTQGLGSPTGLRDLYREITGNPRDAHTLFDELTAKFDYEKMRSVIDFLLHSLGTDLKSKGPSIDRGELHRLFTEARSMQAILSVFRFFKSRMKMLEKGFDQFGLPMPPKVTFEYLAKLFMRLLQERYPSADKVLQMASLLGMLEEYFGLTLVYTQMRDAVRHVAPKLFKSDQHRKDVLSSLIDAIEELDEKIEEEEEKEEKKKKDDF
ncbi:MAG: type III secretion system gatekeeper subunit SctW [Rhabdochlamydiaceae bacterium]|nr:type III secretion system gatekeeper subunit SctW [Rhabdochlamydiaceae bacterium]